MATEESRSIAARAAQDKRGISDVQQLIQGGNEFLAQDRPDDAVVAYKQALDLCPGHPQALCNLASAYRAQARLDEAIACCREAIALAPSAVQVHDNLLFTLHFLPASSASDIFNECSRWNERHAAPLARLVEPHTNDRSPDRRLRIGYVSPDFRAHVLAVFLLPLLSSHDRQRFEIICYSDVVKADLITSHFRRLPIIWRDIQSLTDEQVAALIRRDHIDVLVDVTMHMERNRLLVFARKPAPVQITWLAYPGTTGLQAIDYRLTDPYLDPPGLFDSYYSESTLRLPHTFWCYDPIALTPVGELPALQNGYVTFGSLNNFCKVNTGVLKLWASVLNAVDRSRLIMLAPPGSSREWVLKTLQQEGITSDRIDFVGRQPRGNYLETYHRIDIGLDTWPYNGHTTTLDALWMGVPVVTLVGQTVVGRAGYSQLSNLGLTSLVAHSTSQFSTIASNLAANLIQLRMLRHTLRQSMQRSKLMDTARFAHDLESCYHTAWSAWCNNERVPDV